MASSDGTTPMGRPRTSSVPLKRPESRRARRFWGTSFRSGAADPSKPASVGASATSPGRSTSCRTLRSQCSSGETLKRLRNCLPQRVPASAFSPAAIGAHVFSVHVPTRARRSWGPYVKPRVSSATAWILPRPQAQPPLEWALPPGTPPGEPDSSPSCFVAPGYHPRSRGSRSTSGCRPDAQWWSDPAAMRRSRRTSLIPASRLPRSAADSMRSIPMPETL